MEKTREIVRVVSKALAESPTGVTFFGVNNYQNQNGEVSNFVVNIGTSYDKAVAKDIEYLKTLDVKELNTDIDVTLLETAREELLNSLLKPSETHSQAQKDAYTHINTAIKVHNVTNALYIWGTRISKNILVEGTYKPTNKRPLTVAKDFIRENMRSSKFRLFKVETQPDKIKLSGGTETIIVDVAQ